VLAIQQKTKFGQKKLGLNKTNNLFLRELIFFAQLVR